ncbi:uncharacterized protein LOC134190992 [Corticium candelabrum]|uniref:uncharacterized protein LOC134190992 n=1 Tax=Corticium candelabrum TaxID=121492 RepID=UPI002E26C911|nr:uncharacterized protein LOC134190992 [Corticium candelabrum]
MTILITVSGKFNEKYIANVESALQQLVHLTDCKIYVTLFIDVESMNDSEIETVAKTVANGKTKYQFGIYARAENDTKEDWCRVITNSRDRLEGQLKKYNSRINATVDTFRAKDFLWTNHMFAALNQLNMAADFSYVTAQPLWPFTFPYGSALCDSNEVLQGNKGLTRLCPGRFEHLWEIPNNMLFSECDWELFNCTWLGDCLTLSTSHNETLADLLITNFGFRSAASSFFHKYWQSREPFVLNLEEDFFEKVAAVYNDESNKFVREFLSTTFALFATAVDKDVKDTYFVSASQLVNWMKSKQPSFDIITSGFYLGGIFECKVKYSPCELAVISIPFATMCLHFLMFVVMLIAIMCIPCAMKSFNYKTFMARVMSKRFKLLVPIGFLLTETEIENVILSVKQYQSTPDNTEPMNQSTPDNTEQINQSTPDNTEPINQSTPDNTEQINQSTPDNKEQLKKQWQCEVECQICGKITVFLVLFLFKFVYLAGLLAGPILMFINVHAENNQIETIQEYQFLYLLIVHTVTVAIYFVVSVAVSVYINYGLMELKGIIDELEEAVKRTVNETNSIFQKCIPARRLLVSISTSIIASIIILLHVVALTLSFEQKSIVGWYSTFDCDTAWMYVSYYALLFLMVVMAVFHAYSLDLWAQAAFILFTENRNKASTIKDCTKKSLSKLKDRYSELYSSIFSPLILAPVQAAIADVPVSVFAKYLQKSLQDTDLTGQLLRISLNITILIVALLPYATTILTHWKLDCECKKLKEERSKRNNDVESAENAKRPESTRSTNSQGQTAMLQFGTNGNQTDKADMADNEDETNLLDSPQPYLSKTLFILTAVVALIEVLLNLSIP